MTKKFDRRCFLKTAATGVGAGVVAGCTPNIKMSPTDASSHKSVAGLTVPAMDVVRIGIIGVGKRGFNHVKHYVKIDGCQIKAIADTHVENAERAQDKVVKSGFEKPDI